MRFLKILLVETKVVILLTTIHPLITLRGSTTPAPPELNLVLDHKWRRFQWLHRPEILAISGPAKLFFAKLLIVTGGDFGLRKSVYTKEKPSACN